MNFTTQSELWLADLEQRHNDPVKMSTLATFRSRLSTHILPALGDTDIGGFKNAGLKQFVNGLCATKLKPSTIKEIVSVLKQVVASAVDEEGDQLYPRDWNMRFVRLPVITKRETKQPTLLPKDIELAVTAADEPDAVLYALLAGSGLRINEALALRAQPTDKVSCFDAKTKTLIVRSALWHGIEQSPKTEAGYREVDLAPLLAERVSNFVANRSRFLFGTRGNVPVEHQFRYRLEQALPGKGFHSFRRFRVSHLRKSRAPEDLIRLWTGHAGRSITDSYSHVSEDVQYRRVWAEKVGLGFELATESVSA